MNELRLSRVTIFSLLFALLLGLAIWSHTQARRDDCSSYLAGDKRAPSSEYVVSGSHTVVVPCNQWLPRQPVRVQVLCLLDLLTVVVFAFNLLQDLRGSVKNRMPGNRIHG
jgi:hypothetical protein